MTKDIKKAIIGLVISLFLFALGLFFIITGFYLKIPNEIIRAVIGLLVFSFLIGGFLFSIGLLGLIIAFICIEVHKKADKLNAQLEEKTREELPQNVAFSVNIADVNNEEINQILHENIRCKALFDGEKIYITFYLSDEVKVETDILSFLDNFTY